MTVREEPSPLTGGPRRRPGRHHRPRRSDPRRASRAWSRAPAQKQRPRRRTTSGRGGQGPRSPGSSSAEAIGGARGSSRRHHGTEAPENGAAAIGSGGRGGGRPAPRSGGGRERSRFAPPARGRSWQVLVIGLQAAVRPAGARAGPARGRRPAPGRRRIGGGLRGRPGETPAHSRPTAASRARGRGVRWRPSSTRSAGGLASARAGHTKVGAEGGEFRRSRERAGGADSARGATPPRPERATEHREAAVDDPAPPRPAIRALQDGVFTSSRGGHRPHRAPGICTGTARPH